MLLRTFPASLRLVAIRAWNATLGAEGEQVHRSAKGFPLALAVMLSAVATFPAPVNATTGTLTITTNTTLTEDHFGHIVIGADGVTLDCAGFVVRGSHVGVGVLIAGKQFVTVTNCRVEDFEIGFLLGDILSGVVSFATLTGNTATRNGVGFLLQVAIHNTLTGNTAFGNQDVGFRLSLNSGINTLTGNAAVDNRGDGFRVEGGSVLNVIVGNRIGRNFHGIHICLSLLPPLNKIQANFFGGPQQAYFIDQCPTEV